MIETLTGLPDGVDGFRPVGRVSAAHYEQTVVPVLDRAEAEARRLRMLCVVDSAYTGLDSDAVWEDLKVGFRAMPLLEGCAVVSDIEWIRNATHVAAFLLPYPVRVFHEAEREEAATWLSQLPDTSGFSVRVLDDRAVAVVRIERPLQVGDIAALTRTVDDWCRTHDDLGGLVVSAPSVPGWQNVRTLIRHVRFVVGHHKRIRRIAMAVDGTIGTYAPTVANLALHPEIRHFAHGDEAAAIDWAGAARPMSA